MDEQEIVERNEWLYRRGYCSPEKKYMNPDGTATSRVFKLRESDFGKLSVDVVSLTTAEKSVKDQSKFMLFEIENAEVENLDLETYHSRLTDGSNNAHAVIVGMIMDDEIKPGLLARKSKRVYT